MSRAGAKVEGQVAPIAIHANAVSVIGLKRGKDGKSMRIVGGELEQIEREC
jgi:hypothetical protein